MNFVLVRLIQPNETFLSYFPSSLHLTHKNLPLKVSSISSGLHYNVPFHLLVFTGAYFDHLVWATTSAS